MSGVKREFFVITDMLQVAATGIEYITAYWTGDALSDKVWDAKAFPKVSDAYEVLEEGDFRDPVIYVMEETEDGELRRTSTIDVVNTYGSLGGQ
jgi:hypothetical protein